MSPHRRRRQVLAAVPAIVSVTLAGCTGHGPSLEMEELSDSDLPARAVRGITDASSDRLRPIVETIENGTHELSSPSPQPPVGPARPTVASPVERPIEHEGAYYTIALADTVEGTLTEAEFRIEAAGAAADEGTDGAGEIAYDDLPSADRSRLKGVPSPDLGESDTESELAFYDDAAAAESILVPEPEYDAIVRDGRRYSIELIRAEETAGYTYHYTAERVASTDEDASAWLRSQYRFELTDLPDDEREMIDEAVAESWYLANEGSDAFSTLSERFLSQPALERDGGDGEWFVRYDGGEYLAKLDAPTDLH